MSGFVRDNNDRPVAGAKVVLESAAHAVIERQTDSTGRFDFPNVAIGQYMLTISERDFASLSQPVTVQASELTQALATGVVDSYMSSGSTGFDTKTYESIKNFYDTQAWLPKNAVIINQQAFAALDKPTQDALLKAAADAETRGWKASEDKNGWYLDQLKQKGMTIVKPAPQLTADLKKVGDTMLQDWLKKAGPKGQSAVDAYRKM